MQPHYGQPGPSSTSRPISLYHLLSPEHHPSDQHLVEEDPHSPDVQKALLQKLLQPEATAAGGRPASSSSFAGPHSAHGTSRLEKLLERSPSDVARSAECANQVILALQRPETDQRPSRCEVPAGFATADSHVLPFKAQQEQNAKIIHWILSDPTAKMESDSVWKLSSQMHGCWIVQQALGVADRSVIDYSDGLRDICGKVDAKTVIARGLQGHVNEAITHLHANYVLQKCIEVLPRPATRFILEEIINDDITVHAAKNQYGCRVLQRLIEHFGEKEQEQEEQGFIRMVEALIAEDQRLARRDAHEAGSRCNRLVNDKYANFVFQSLLEHGGEHGADVVEKVLAENSLLLARERYASHVLSAALKDKNQDITKIIEDLLFYPGPSRNAVDPRKMQLFCSLAKDRWGSFVFKQVKKREPKLFQGCDTQRTR